MFRYFSNSTKLNSFLIRERTFEFYTEIAVLEINS